MAKLYVKTKHEMKQLYDKIIVIDFGKAVHVLSFGKNLLRELEEEFHQKAEWDTTLLEEIN